MGANASRGSAPNSVRKNLANPSGQMLQPYQCVLLRKAWGHMSKTGTSNIGDMVLKRMFAKSPEIKVVFQHVAVIDGVFGMATALKTHQCHAAYIVQLLDETVKDLNHLDLTAERCVTYGAQHAHLASYGLKTDHWDVFGQAMTESAREWEGWRKHRETLKAWTLLVSFIVDRLRSGFESNVKRRQTQASLGVKLPQRSASYRESSRARSPQPQRGSKTPDCCRAMTVKERPLRQHLKVQPFTDSASLPGSRCPSPRVEGQRLPEL